MWAYRGPPMAVVCGGAPGRLKFVALEHSNFHAVKPPPIKAYHGDDVAQNSGRVPVEFLLIFDQRTGKLAAPDGVLIIGSPIVGSIGQYGGVQAIYAGGGWW